METIRQIVVSLGWLPSKKLRKKSCISMNRILNLCQICLNETKQTNQENKEQLHGVNFINVRIRFSFRQQQKRKWLCVFFNSNFPGTPFSLNLCMLLVFLSRILDFHANIWRWNPTFSFNSINFIHYDIIYVDYIISPLPLFPQRREIQSHSHFWYPVNCLLLV